MPVTWQFSLRPCSICLGKFWYWSWRSLHRHNLSFTGYARRPGVTDVSGPKRSRLLGSNYPVWRSWQEHWRQTDLPNYTNDIQVQRWLSPSTLDSTLARTQTGHEACWAYGLTVQDCPLLPIKFKAGYEACRGGDGSGPAGLQWCLGLASGAVSHGDGALSLPFNCARLSLNTIQVWTPATTDRLLRRLVRRLPQSDVGSGQHDSDIWRRCRASAGRNAQSQIKTRQSVITPVQHITPDSDGTRQKHAGRLISSA